MSFENTVLLGLVVLIFLNLAAIGVAIWALRLEVKRVVVTKSLGKWVVKPHVKLDRDGLPYPVKGHTRQRGQAHGGKL